MKTVSDIPDFKGKKVLLRTDFDVPILTNDQRLMTSNKLQIAETFRIHKQKPMIDYLLDGGAKVVMVSHISAVNSFKPILPQLESLLNRPIHLEAKLPSGSLASGLTLLDNIRRWPGEKENSNEFAKQLGTGFDFYINNAFAVCHRRHASISAIVKFLPSYAGLLTEEETENLNKVINSSKESKIIIIGGAKAETKIPVIKNLIDKSEKIILGGVVANDIFKERGMDIDDSLADKNSKELFVGLDIYDSRLVLADDFNAPGGKILDIGPASISKFIDLIGQAKMVIWNGPMGLFENSDYAKGTYEIAKALANLNSFRVIGGGDTITAVNRLGILNKFNFVSTGGGAMLAFLAGEKLPGLEALGYY
ncbi:MAG: hypothetical protein A2817_03615 [Candidatus Yanofskybacteria bacterium RIFCSPHIGHO2_01_FULL_39_8b]|uniref:Phosphoglycerate kinase n=1 Tax=Candidatus Yanofskybacteria bacterium RIFCSPHIGHO2_01_FULL_39_8b TaxID=1802659 RepID=A0A1F8EC74_9BACT|nr:MAG: hypothetical protein A2817_03615 [Candidatus Yanofskybacteria bacterium RIFCSPHIGHO2_01_FULL_39_8b]